MGIIETEGKTIKTTAKEIFEIIEYELDSFKEGIKYINEKSFIQIRKAKVLLNAFRNNIWNELSGKEMYNLTLLEKMREDIINSLNESIDDIKNLDIEDECRISFPSEVSAYFNLLQYRIIFRMIEYIKYKLIKTYKQEVRYIHEL